MNSDPNVGPMAKDSTAFRVNHFQDEGTCLSRSSCFVGT